MKFEIDDKTGRGWEINNEDQRCTIGYYTTQKLWTSILLENPNFLELRVRDKDEITLNKIKEVNEKILNRLIQNIQDSKNLRKYGSSKYASRESVSTDNTIGIQKGKLRPDEKIVQNQKIVDLLIQHYQHAEHNDITVANILSEIYDDATGKHIKDL